MFQRKICKVVGAATFIEEGAAVISKNFNKGALGANTPISRVWSTYSNAHIFKDGNVIISFNTVII